MRIAVTGPHGVGKTTLAKALSKKLQMPLIAEQARVVAKMLGVKHADELYYNKNLARDFQTAVLVSQLGMEQAFFQKGFVSDRSALDCLAYWQIYGLDKHNVNDIYRRKCLSQKYDYFVYVPFEGLPLKDDGFRSIDPDKAAEVDRVIKNLLQQVSAPMIMVFGTLDERIATVLKLIEGEVKNEPLYKFKTNIGA